VTKQKAILLGVGIALAVLLGLYFHGNLDRTLYPVGLNFRECARNGFGATFCGKELDEYRARLQRVKETTEHGKVSLEETERKSHEEQASREQTQANEAHARALNQRTEREQQLAAKLKQERAIEEREPEGSVAYDIAKGEYEATRAEAQQLLVETKSEEGK
jgi:hypothetical protein